MSKGFVPMIRVKSLDFTGTDYEGLEVKAWVNYPLGLEDELQSGDSARMREAVARIVREWNLCDQDGEPLGKPDAETMKKVPTDILLEIIRRTMEAVKEGMVPPNAARRSGNN